jgi:hypothetical protein
MSKQGEYTIPSEAEVREYFQRSHYINIAYLEEGEAVPGINYLGPMYPMWAKEVDGDD